VTLSQQSDSGELVPITAPSVPGRGPAPALTSGVSGEDWGATDFEQGGRARTGKPRIFEPGWVTYTRTHSGVSRGRLADLQRHEEC
jgi:hypothetical protein